MLEVVVYGRLGRRNGLDAFHLTLLDDASNVFGNVLAQSEDAAMADRAIGTKEGLRHACISIFAKATLSRGQKLTEVVRQSCDGA